MLQVNSEELHIINVIQNQDFQENYQLFFKIYKDMTGYFKKLNNFDVDIAVIPKGIDKYMSIIVNRHITFIDSLQFYNSSLDTLASNLNNEDFKYLVSEFGINKLEILRRKGTYPYEWVIHMKNLNTHPQLRKDTFIHY